MSVYDILSRPLTKLCGLSKAQARPRVLELTGLCGLNESDLQKYPHEFSGGQRQRIAIARALLTKPKFVVADEPTSALDVSIQAQILNLLKDLKRGLSFTMLFISHNIATVLFLSDRVAIMNCGRIVETIRADKLVNYSVHPYTRELVAAIPKGPSAMTSATGNHTRPVRAVSASPFDSRGERPKCGFLQRCSLATPVCEEVIPDLREIEPGHFVACDSLSAR